MEVVVAGDILLFIYSFFFFQPTPFGILGSLYIQRCVLNNTGKKGEKST
jgi:hypothetical protein